MFGTLKSVYSAMGMGLYLSKVASEKQYRDPEELRAILLETLGITLGAGVVETTLPAEQERELIAA
ncbi:MAG: hypothetical protein WD533_05980 [Dehalococcoidia bacterium]